MSATHRRPTDASSRRCTTGCSATPVEGACMLLGFALVVWSLTPIYNMWMIALDSHDDIFSGTHLAGEPDAGGVPRRRHRGLLVPGAVLASVRQQLLSSA